MKHWFAVVAVVFATAGVAACGDDDNETAPSAAEQAASEDAQAAADAAEEAQAQVDELEQELEQQEQELKQEQKEPEPAPEPEPEPEPAPEPEPSEPPNVVGLTLPAAKQLLKEAGFKANVSNTDAALGILIPQNYTICEQSPPRGTLVPILAQKDGC